VQLLQFGARVGAELLGEAVLELGVGVERLGVPAGGMQRPHQDEDQRFHQRVFRGEVTHRRDHRFMVGQSQLDLRPGQHRVEVPLPATLAEARHPGAGKVRQRDALPQSDRLA
jgi:hypothetical protein